MAIPAQILDTEVLDPVLERTSVGVGVVRVAAVVVEEAEAWLEQVVIVEGAWVVL